ncbi:MAG: DUF2182 domain-containing protein [Sphingomonadales bacterium]|nr:DUF2182 domain-containing protein [Sphingomonadales bacterium]
MGAPVDAALARHQAVSAVALAILILIAWVWLLWGAGMGTTPQPSPMPGAGGVDPMAGMAMDAAAPSTAGRFVLTLAMWWVMMVAMMLPSAAPTILLYARVATAVPQSPRPASGSFLAGYLAVWGSFALLAALLQLQFERIGMITAGSLVLQSRMLSGAVLIAAGLYQLGPLKNACLRHCQSPAQFLTRQYRPGPGGAFRMGLLHGAFCLGCCWLLMALLFVGGIMNLAWIALLTTIVAAEKLLPFGRLVARIGGGALLIWGATLMFA